MLLIVQQKYIIENIDPTKDKKVCKMKLIDTICWINIFV